MTVSAAGFEVFRGDEQDPALLTQRELVVTPKVIAAGDYPVAGALRLSRASRRLPDLQVSVRCTTSVRSLRRLAAAVVPDQSSCRAWMTATTRGLSGLIAWPSVCSIRTTRRKTDAR